MSAREDEADQAYDDHKAMQILRDKPGTLVGQDFGLGDQHWQFIWEGQISPICEDPATAIILFWEGARYDTVTKKEIAQLLAAVKKQAYPV